MKWLIIQTENQSKWRQGWTPNWHMRECYSFQYALNTIGIQADTWGKYQDNFDVVPDFESYDVIICIENYDSDWLPDFATIKSPTKIHWVIDLHIHNPLELAKISNGCDIILHSTRSLMADYTKLVTAEHIWFPNCIDDRFFGYRQLPKVNDLVFVGSDNPARSEIIGYLKKIGLVSVFITGQDMIDIIAATKIHFNKNIRCDINYRTFETIGIGTCLLTDYNLELTDLGFADGINCLLYKTAEDAATKATEALRSESWHEISQKGHELSKQHTYISRIQSILRIIS